MLKTATFIILLTVFTAIAATFQIPAKHLPVANTAVTGILECRFDDVLRVTDSAYAADGNPLAAVLHLAALGMRDVDFDSTIDAAGFERAAERAGGAINGYEGIHGRSSYSVTLRGLILGMTASFHLKNKSYVKAGDSGLEMIKTMREARELDSTNTEVNFFLGMYDYGRADLRKRLRGVLFWFPGDKESGIRLLEEGARSAIITRAACALALSDIYLKEGRPRQSREIIDKLKREMPQSRFVLWAEAKYFEDQKMFAQAAEVYGRLAESYENEIYGSYSHIVTASRAAHNHDKASEHAAAADICKRILERGSGGDKRADAIIKDIRKLYGRLTK
jgi:tetratricopeptide (TPR) repeat protein